MYIIVCLFSLAQGEGKSGCPGREREGERGWQTVRLTAKWRTSCIFIATVMFYITLFIMISDLSISYENIFTYISNYMF